MNRFAGVLRVITIVLNAIFLVSTLVIIANFGSPSLHPVVVIIPLLGTIYVILSLVMAKTFFRGVMRPVSITLILLLNLMLISTVIYCFAAWGMPGLPCQMLLIPLWFLLPVITCVTAVMVKK